MSSIVTKLFGGKKFELYQIRHRKTGRIHYKIKTDLWLWKLPGYVPNAPTSAELRNHFDPSGSIASRTAYSWKFSNRKDAEKLLMLAILKWGA